MSLEINCATITKGEDQLATQAISWWCNFPQSFPVDVHEVLHCKVIIGSWPIDVLTGARKHFVVGVAARRRFWLIRRWRKLTIILLKTLMSWTTVKKVSTPLCLSIHRMLWLCRLETLPVIDGNLNLGIHPRPYIHWELFVHLLAALDTCCNIDCVSSFMYITRILCGDILFRRAVDYVFARFDVQVFN